MRPIPAVPMPLSVQDWREACHAGAEAPAALAEALRRRHGALAAFAVSSGRAALWLALKALRRLRPDRERVILPAYTCPTVGRAVQAAGLQGLCADVSLEDFAIAPAAVEELLDGTVLAVVAPHMFGMACDVRRLTELCQQHGAVLIEDLAQACGAECRGRAVGTFGGVAFNSLGRSKSVRGYKGGVLWVNAPELVGAIGREHDALPPPSGAATGPRLRQLAVILLSRPNAWNAARRLSFLRVGAEDQGFDEQPTRLAPWQAALGSISLERVDEYNAVRRRIAADLLEELAQVTDLQPQTPASGCDSTYLRLAVRLEGPAARRAELLRRLQASGADARTFYTRVMYRYGWWKRDPRQPDCSNAANLLSTNLILPIHHAMRPDQVAGVAQVAKATMHHAAHPVPTAMGHTQ